MRFIFVGSHFIPVVEKGEVSKRCCCDCQASASKHEAGRSMLLEKLLAEAETKFWKDPIAIKECPLECCIGSGCSYTSFPTCTIKVYDPFTSTLNPGTRSNVQGILDAISQGNSPHTLSQCRYILLDLVKEALKGYHPGDAVGVSLISILSIALDKVRQEITKEKQGASGFYRTEGVAEEALTEEELQHIYNKLAAGDMSVLHEGDSAEPDSLLSLVEQKLREALKPECQNLRVNTLDILIRLWAVIRESSKE